MGRLRQAAVDAGQPEKLLLLRSSWWATYFRNEWPEERVARSWGVWAPAKRPLNTSRTERNTLAQQTPWHHGYLEPSFRHGVRWTEPFQHSGWKNICVGPFFDVFFWGRMFCCSRSKKKIHLGLVPKTPVNNRISTTLNWFLRRISEPSTVSPTSSNIYQLNPFPPTEGAEGGGSKLSRVDDFFRTFPGFWWDRFSNPFSGG